MDWKKPKANDIWSSGMGEDLRMQFGWARI